MIHGWIKRELVIQETDVKQWSARMVDPLNTFQFTNSALEQDVLVRLQVSKKGMGDFQK